jgi:hypothetical protein
MTAITALYDIFRYLGLALMVVVLFVFFALIAIAIRPLMIVAAFIAAIVSLALYCFSTRFREWVKVAGTERFDV